MSGARLALILAVLASAGCGGGESEAVPAEWCDQTKHLLYMLDQHSTTDDTETVSAWEESTPEQIRSSSAEFADVLRRYPVDAHDDQLVAARKEIEEYADDRCPGGSTPEP
jgi:ABC-type glycerol-3-phosphate transport system substrate-binding protein